MEEVEPIIEELESDEEGNLTEIYRDKRTGNIVTHPMLRSKGNAYYDPRRDVCWDLYVKSWKSGYPNARDAARKAGYSENTAINIGNLKWFKDKKDKLRRSKMMDNAERNIARILNMGYTKIKELEDGTKAEEVDKDVLRIVADMSKTIVTTLGKDMGYSTKSEVKHSVNPVPIMDVSNQIEAPQEDIKDITPELD
jgi:phage terminase small subunit